MNIHLNQCAWTMLLLGFVCSGQARAFQADAPKDAPTRTWRDASGKFEIEATLVDRNDKQVRLRKSDGRVVAVPLDRLSESDRELLRSLGAEPKSENPFAGGVPSSSPKPQPPSPAAVTIVFPASTKPAAPAGTVLPADGPAMQVVAGEPPQGLAADPAPYNSALTPGGFYLTDADAYDDVAPPIVLDHEAGLLAVSIGRNVINRPDETRGRIYAGRLPQGPANLVWDVREAVQLLDHHAASDRSLIMSGLDHFDRGGEIVVLQGLVSGQPKELYRRKLPGMDAPGFKPQISWAVLLDPDHIAAVLNDRLSVWNLRTAEVIYQIDALRAGCHPIASPGRRYLVIPMQGGATIIQAVDGRSLGHFPGGGLLMPEVGLHPDGKRLALCAGNQLVVSDITTGQTSVNAVLPRPLGGQPFGWVGQDLLLSAMGDLIRTDLEMAIWSYSLTSAKPRGVPAGIVLATTNGKCNIVSLSVPHRAASQAESQMEKGGDAMLLVRPGSSVALSAEALEGVDRNAMLNALRECVERTGWKVVNRADTTVAAIIGRGKPQQLQFRSTGPGIPLATAPTETVSITPFTARLEIRRDGQVLWSRETANLVPPLIMLKDGEKLQDAVKKYERPDPEFFSRLQVPPRVPKPEIASGLGRSSLEGMSWKDYPVSAGAPSAGRRRGK